MFRNFAHIVCIGLYIYIILNENGIWKDRNKFTDYHLDDLYEMHVEFTSLI